MRARGRPVLGAIAGLLFLLSLDVVLVVFGVVAVNSIVLVILPLAGIVLGILWAFIAPLGPRTPPPGYRERTAADT